MEHFTLVLTGDVVPSCVESQVMVNYASSYEAHAVHAADGGGTLEYYMVRSIHRARHHYRHRRRQDSDAQRRLDGVQHRLVAPRSRAAYDDAVALSGAHVLITGGAGLHRLAPRRAACASASNRIRVLDTLPPRRAAPRRPARAPERRARSKATSWIRPPVRRAMDGIDARRAPGVDRRRRHRHEEAGADHAHLAPRHRQRARRGARAAGAASASSTSRRREVFGRYAYHVTEFDVTTLGAVGEARWTYAVAKLATEHLAMTYHRQHGFPAVGDPPLQHLRPAPGRRGRGAPLHRARAQGRAAQVHNDGSQIRAWCYIDDIVDAVERVLADERAVGHAFNIGNPRSTVTIYNLAREIVRLSSSGSRIEQVEWNHPDVELRVPAWARPRSCSTGRPRSTSKRACCARSTGTARAT